jgi:hypothetical protein
LKKGKEKKKEGMKKGHIENMIYPVNYGIRWKGYCLILTTPVNKAAKIITVNLNRKISSMQQR